MELRVQSPLRVASGSTTAVVVEIVNRADEVREFVVSTVGLDPAWVGLPVACGPVSPGASVSAELSVTVPPGSPAGSFPFLVSVQALHSVNGAPAGAAVEADLALVIGDASKLSLQLEPREPAGVRGRRFKVAVDNRTPDDLVVALQAQGSRGLYLRHKARPVPVRAGEIVRVRMQALVHRKLAGQPRRMQFVVTAQGATTPVRLDGVFVARPLFNSTVTKVAAVLAVLALWASVSMLALNTISSKAHKEPASLSAGGATGGGDGPQGGNPQGGSSGGSSGSAGGKPSTAALTSSSRLNGVVTGPEPGGVTVTLQPTSLVDEAAEGASFLTPRAASKTGKLAASLVAYTKATPVSAKRSTTTQADGSWAFAGVSKTGYYMLSFAKAGYQTRRYVVSQDGSTPAPLKVPLVAGSGRLSGLVTAAALTAGKAAAPAGGATVVITDGTVTLTTTTPTKGDVGRWSLDGLSTPGAYLVSVSAPGYATSSKLVKLKAGGSADRVDLSLARGLESLSGQINQLTATGTTAGGVTVTATNGTLTRTATTVSREGAGGTSALLGRFVLPALPLGDYTVTLSAPGYATSNQKVTLDGKAPEAKLPDTLLTQSGATFLGTVRDSAGPIVGAGLVLTSSTDTYKITSADDGSYAFTGVTPGSYVLSAEKFQHVTSFASVEAIAGKTLVVPLTLDAIPDTGLPTTGFIRGRIVDARNGGLVLCPATNASCITVSTPGTARIPVAPDAEYLLPHDPPGLTPGLHVVTIEAPGYETATVKVQVPVGGTAIAPVVALQPRAALTGKITPGAPAPLPTTCVVIVPYDGKTAPSVTGCRIASDATCAAVPAATSPLCAVVDASGNYTISNLPRSGPYYVFVTPATDTEWVPVPGVPLALGQGETKRYDATMTRLGRIHVLLRVPASVSGLQAPAATVSVTATPIDPVSFLPLSTPAPTTVSSGPSPDFGEATLKGLASGTYQLKASGPLSGGTFTGLVEVVQAGLNQTAEATVVLSSTAANAFAGRVIWTQNVETHPVANAQVVIKGTTGYTGTTEVPGTVTITTDQNGCYGVGPGGSLAGVTLPAGCATALPSGSIGSLSLANSRVTLDIDGSKDFTTHAARGFGSVKLSTTVTMGNPVLTPLTTSDMPFTGKVKATGTATPDFSKAKITVTSAALGSGTIVVTPATDGTLTWKDSAADNAANKVHPGTYKLTASLPGYDDDSTSVDCLLDGTGVPPSSCNVTLTVGTHAKLTVVVKDAGGNAVTTGAVVTISGGNIATTTVTAPPGSGTVQFNDLSAAAGTFILSARAPGYAKPDDVLVSLTSGGSDSATVVLTKLGTVSGTVSGRIGAQLSPLAGVTVTARATRAAQGAVPAITYSFSAVTSADGSYVMTGTLDREGLPLDAGDWTVTATSPAGSGYTNPASVTRTFPTDAATVETHKTLAGTDFILDADLVAAEITVRDDSTATGVLVTDATVSLTDAAGVAHPVTAVGPSRPGVYAVSDLQPTVHTLTVTAPSRSPLTTSVTLQPSVAVTQISVLLADRRNAIALHVLGQIAGGAPVPLDHAVVALSKAGTPLPASPYQTNALGDLQVGGLDDGTYRIVVTGPSSTSYTSVTRDVTLASGQLAAVEATLQRVLTTVTVDVASATGDSMAGALVSLVARGNGAASQAPQQAGAAASTVFNQVVPGDYLITTTGPGGHLGGSKAVTIGDVATFTDTVTVAEAKINLTLTTTEPVKPTATVTITPAIGAVATRSQAADGSSELLYVPTGSYTITAAAPGYSSTPVTGSSGGAVSIALAKTQTGTVTVAVTEDGTALKNATVTVAGSPTVYTTGPGAASVVVGGLAPGGHDVTVLTPDGQTQTKTATVVLDANVDVSFAFTTPAAPATGSLTVTVSRNGAVLQGAAVTVTAQTAAKTTDASGQVSFAGLVPGTYAVTATKDGQSVTGNTTTDATATNVLTLVLPNTPPAPASLAVTVKDGTAIVSGATVVAQSSAGSASGTTNASGGVTLTGLAAGTYTVSATTVDGRSGSSNIALAAGQSGTLVVPVTATNGAFDITVKRGGSAQLGATVTLSGPGSASGTTDAAGQHTFVGLAPGTYSVQAAFTTGGTSYTYNGTVTVVSGGTVAQTVTIA